MQTPPQKKGKKMVPRMVLTYDLQTPPILKKEAFLDPKEAVMIYISCPPKDGNVDHELRLFMV